MNNYSRLVLSYLSNMSLQKIKNNAVRIKDTMDSLKSDLKLLNDKHSTLLAKKLKKENDQLIQAIEEAKKRLIQLEVQNGVKQVPLPSRKSTTQISDLVIDQNIEPKVLEKQDSTSISDKKQKEEKPKKPKEPKEIKADLPIDIARLDLRIGHIDKVEKHPEADTLYLLQISCGEEKPRTVCSGLVKHVPIEKLRDQNVVLLCNLKPVKMRGIVSEAMVMCASCEKGVEVLSPPPGCSAGDLVECEGYTRNPDPVMNPKKKIFETVAPDLHTNESLLACYKNKLLNVAGKGNIMAKTLKNVPIK
ncbi:hypothetical protein WA026_005825 [Henosepilachna vigintioctopunctata]|uniref:tRNA-binding domain-containing protein n=1 Tax=Henosepilachna vigintioctopunctata TaxID=420089 RepID=A0AAW1U4C5_9CUCU